MLTRETLMADNGNYSSEDFLEALCSRLSIQKLPAIVLTDNLNSSRYAVLQSSSILCMLESLKQEVCFAPFNTERFISSVNNFKEYRNDTPHPIVIDREDFRRMDRMFDSLFQGMDDSSVQPQTKPSGTRNNRFIVCKILS